MTDEHPTQTLNVTRARQGLSGRHIFWILVVSTVLAAVGLFGAWGMRAKDIASVEHNAGVSNAQEAARYDTPQVPARQTAAP